MSISAALHAAVATYRRPADLLPVYALGAAVPAIARVFAFSGLVASYLYLLGTGRLAPVVAELASRDLNPPDPEASPEAFGAWVDSLVPAFEPLFTPAVVGALAAGVLASVLAMVLLGAAVSAGQVATVAARLRDERGLTAGIAGVRRHWLSFLGLYLLEAFLWIAVSALALIPALVAFSVHPLVGALVGLVAVLGWLVAVIVVRATFAIAPPAVVIDGVGVVGSLRGSVGFIRVNPIDAMAYYGIAVGALVGFSVVVGAFSLVDAGSVAGPLALLVVTPALDLVKTGLYADHRGALSPPRSPEVGLPAQLGAGLRRGVRSVGDFVRATPGLHALSIAVGAGGFAAGWSIASPFVGSLSASIADRLAEHVPPFAAVDFFANNWTVAISTGYAGVAGALPSAIALGFNGLLLGAYARLEVDPVALVAFVVPHGLFEVPALVVSGALGLYLGLAWWRTWRGPAGRRALADAMERAFWVLVGVGVLLAIAGFIEGFVSPYYYRPFA